MLFSQNAFALSSIVFILVQFLDELPQCDTIISSYSTGAYNSTATIDTICLNRSFPHPLLGLLLGKLDNPFCLY